MKGLLPLAWFLACSVPVVQGGLLDLKSMIEKVTGKNALKNYGFYGCYCGWGGQGTPKDGTDEPGPFCRVQLCACDRKLVYCLKRNLWSYNPRYQYFPNILCF
uniref:Phospholipase A2 n=1 Tax=Saimiri boliviensis boliviensis TaxID=39432 RepID=A0A2K6TU65_SAIBB